MLVTTSGILQEQKFSKPRSIGYSVTGVIADLDKLKEVLVDLLGEIGEGSGPGSGSGS
jgi:hypothetical protein